MKPSNAGHTLKLNHIEQHQEFSFFTLTNLIQRISMRTDQLVAILRECQIAYLTPCVDGVYTVSRETVPETDAPVGGAPAAR